MRRNRRITPRTGIASRTGMVPKAMMVLWLSCSILVTALGGCSPNSIESGTAQGVTLLSMESTPVVDYIVPEQTPNVLVNQKGYQEESQKKAILIGKKLPEEFTLIDAETGKEVYRGRTEKITENKELGLYVGYADFSDYAESGSYYLECQGIGRSYVFPIQEKIYGAFLKELQQEILEQSGEQEISVWELIMLLTTYEWYPVLYGDEDNNEIPDVLEELADRIAQITEADREPEEQTLYVAFLAKFSYLYQKYDRGYATECLQRASALHARSQSTVHRDAESFLALTELYRAEGLYRYRQQILDYKSFFENNSSCMEEQEYLFGAMTYMVTRQSVNVELCQILMEQIMSRGEEISVRYLDMTDPLSARNNGAEDLLKRAGELACANYIMNNYRYKQIMEELQHYLMGRNRQSVCFYPLEGQRAGYLLLCAQLAAVSETQEEE